MKIILTQTLFILICTQNIYPNTQESKIAVTDIQVLLKAYIQKTKQTQQIQQFNTTTKQSIQQYKTKLHALRQAIPATKESPQKLYKLEQTEQQFHQFLKRKNKKLNALKQRIKKQALRKILTLLEKYRKDQDLHIILNKTETLAFNSTLDITQTILKQIKELS